ncbi:MAG: hypothetical protein IPK60_20065 [Sandaracinaceae bacterium]|nr:hypothetical protein [Sandaracinaceae bacterium]
MSRAFAASVASLVAICACGHAPASTRAVPQRPAGDEAVELAALLPRGAMTCAAARPSLVDRAHTAQVTPLSSVTALAWLPALSVRAVAQRRQTPLYRAGGSITLMRFDVTREEARRVLHAQRIERVAFADEPDSLCHDAECVASTGVVSFVDEHTLRIVSGFWNTNNRGTNTDCAALLESAPAAFEVAANAWGMSDQIAKIVLHATPSGVEIQTELPPGLEVASLSAGRAPSIGHLGGPTWTRIELRDGRPVLIGQRRWDDLQLELEDQARARAALAREHESASVLVPVDEVDVSNDSAFYEQLALRGADHEGLLAERVRLLERRVSVVPSDEQAVSGLVEEYLREQRFGEVVALVDRLFPAGAPAAGLYREHARAAAVRIDSPGFAQRLVDDHLVSRRDAPALAAMLRANLEDDVQAYPSYERATLAEFFVQRSRATTRVSPLATAIRGPVAALPAVLAAILQRASGSTTQYLIRFAGHTGARGLYSIGMGTAYAHVLGDDASRGVAWIQAPAVAGPQAVTQHLVAGEALRQVAADGAFELSFYAADDAAMRARLVVRATLDADDLATITAVSSNARSLAWDDVERYFLAPLSTLTPQVFPPPTFRISPETAERTNEMHDFMTARGILCETDGLTALTCRMPTEGPVLGIVALHDFLFRHLDISSFEPSPGRARSDG